MLDAVLRAYRAGDCGEHRGEDDRVRERPQPDIAKNKRKRTIRVTTKVGHAHASPRGTVIPPSALAHPIAENGKSIRPNHDFCWSGDSVGSCVSKMTLRACKSS